jgi:beta-ketodecanoyl-[acyl-carrier-protein] synthase
MSEIVPVISATGLYTPPESISNAELVESFNTYVERFNAAHAAEIAAGTVTALAPSSVEFIEKASGIKARHVMSKASLLDPDIMFPRWPERPDDELSVLGEMGVKAAQDALQRAGRDAKDVDAVLCAASNMQRPYPAMAVEIQNALGIDGFGFDMNVACSSATFGIQTAADFIRAGNARSVLVVSPEICTGHLNCATATATSSSAMWRPRCWSRLRTWPRHSIGTFSAPSSRRCSPTTSATISASSTAPPETVGAPDKLFVQEGRKVFKEVVPMVATMIVEEAERLGIDPAALRRLWLHQANAGDEPPDRAAGAGA